MIPFCRRVFIYFVFLYTLGIFGKENNVVWEWNIRECFLPGMNVPLLAVGCPAALFPLWPDVRWRPLFRVFRVLIPHSLSPCSFSPASYSTPLTGNVSCAASVANIRRQQGTQCNHWRFVLEELLHRSVTLYFGW